MSEPITWRMAKTHYRIKGSRCTGCGMPYFPPKAFCNREGRRSRMEDIYLGDRIGRIYSGSVGRETTTKFNYLNNIFSVYVSFQEGPYEVRVAGRLTDYIPPYGEVKISDFIGREVVPRFRRVYDDGLIYYSRLQFSLLDDYYESHLTKGFEAILKDQSKGKVGIVGYGAYIPKYRIKVGEIARAYGMDPATYRGSVMEKSVAFYDEDTRTFSVEAAERAIYHAGIDKGEIDAVAVGSESNPYAVYPVAVCVTDACGINPYNNSFDVEFACKAATSQVTLAYGAIKAGVYRNALIIGADNSQARPGDPLDYSVGAGSAALVMGGEGVIATLENWAHYTSDTPDFYRRDGERYPDHGGRFTGEQAYFRHVINAAKALLEKTGLKASDFDYFIAHQPNMKFPRSVGKILGFNRDQCEVGMVVDYIGNLYAGSTFAGLSAILDIAKPGERILSVSYGSGAGADAYEWLVTEEIEAKRERVIPIKSQIFHPKREYVSYDFYRKTKEN